MKRNHKDDNEIDLGGVEDLTEALDGVNAKTYRKPSDVDVPEPEVKDPTDDLDSHRTASEMDHPRGSVRMKHFDKQTRDAIQRVLESLVQGNAEDIALEDTAGRYTATDVEAAMAEIAGAGRAAETVVGNAGDIIINAADIAALTAIKSTSANYAVLDNDGYAVILVTVGSVSDKTITLPTLAGNQARPLLIIKVDTGTKEGIVDGEGAETIEGFTTVRLINQYDFIHIVGGPATWLRRAGPIAPVSGEPSLGTGHWRGDSAGAAAILDQNPTVANTWYTVTFSNAPAGARAVWAAVYLTRAATATVGCAARKKGDTIARTVSIEQMRADTILSLLGMMLVPIDSAKKGELCVSTGATRLRVYEVIFYDI